MYHQKKLVLPVLTSLLFAASPSVLANEHHCCQDEPLSLIFGTGISFSEKTRLSVNTNFWDPANEGYNARLRESELYTAGLGYRFTPLLGGSLEVNHRPSYRYSKFQTPGLGATPGPLGTKTRKFRLSNTNIMANVTLNGSGMGLFTNLGSCKIQPFVGAGLGIAYNRVFDFHSVLATSAAGFNNVASIMNEKVTKSLAWQLMLGAELALTQKFDLDIGYRYLDSGRFKSNNYITDIPGGAGGGVSTRPTGAPPWKGKLRAHEIFLNLKYRF